MCNTPERKLLDVKELYTPSKNMISNEGSADYSLPGFSAQNLHYLHDDEDLSSDSEGSGDEYAEFYYDDYMYALILGPIYERACRRACLFGHRIVPYWSGTWLLQPLITSTIL